MCVCVCVCGQYISGMIDIVLYTRVLFVYRLFIRDGTVSTSKTCFLVTMNIACFNPCHGIVNID